MTRHPLPLIRPLWILAAHLALCAAARAALYVTWPTQFASLSAGDVLAAFASGLVFDLSVVTIATAPIVLLSLLPFGWSRRRAFADGAAWLAFATWFALALVLAADLHYFGTVGRHFGSEALAVVDDPSLMLAIVREEYTLSAVVALVALPVAAWLWRRAMRWDTTCPLQRVPRWSLVVVVPFAALAIRGRVAGKPIGVVDAFDAGSVPRGYLALNGAFSLTHALLDDAAPPTHFMPWNEARAEVRAQTFRFDEHELDGEFPLLRCSTPADVSRPNVVVVLLESWDAEVVDAVRATRGEAPLGLTPNVDALARRGVLLTRCFAAGQRSTHGLLAVLAGLPTLPGFPYLGRGIEQSQLGFLGALAHSEGYRTLMMQGSAERSFRIDSIAALAGFERYLGKESIASARGVEPMADWGVWDGDLFAQANDELAELERPFAAVLFTTSTHMPYQSPEGSSRPYPSDSDEHRFWNSVHYADAEIGRFVERGERDGWLANTVLVLVADHCSPLRLDVAEGPARHDVFGLVIAPGLEPRIESGVVSQLDLLPTIVELAHWRAPHASLGRSLVESPPRANSGALCVRGEIVMRVEEQGWVSHDLRHRLESNAWNPGADLDALERRLLASVQVTSHALERNHVFRAQFPSAPATSPAAIEAQATISR